MLANEMITRRNLLLAAAALAAGMGARSGAAEDDPFAALNIPFAALNDGRYLPLYDFLSTQLRGKRNTHEPHLGERKKGRSMLRLARFTTFPTERSVVVDVRLLKRKESQDDTHGLALEP